MKVKDGPSWFTSTLVLLSIFVCSACGTNREGAKGPVRVVSWGGNLQDQLVAHWISAAADAEGLDYEVETWDGDMAALALRIRRGVNTWDLVHVEAQDAFRPDRQDLFQGYPTRVARDLEERLKSKPIVKEGIGLPVMEWAYVLTYRSDKLRIPSARPPDWASLWELQKYPGTRGLRDWPMGMIEIALLSMGRDVRAVLYDESLGRPEIETQIADALGHLSKIAASTVWWETGDQLQRGVASGEMVLATGYSGRVAFEARDLCPENPRNPACPIGINPATAIIATDWWVIPKNARRGAEARRLLEAMYSAPISGRGASRFSSALGYRIPIRGLAVSDPISTFLDVGSSTNQLAQLQIDERFWSEHFHWIHDRWRLWRSRASAGATTERE